MSAEHKALALRWFEEWWNQRRDAVFDEVASPDCVATVEGLDGELTRDDLLRHREAWLSAVPDVHVEVVAAVSEGNTVIVNWRARGTHTGPGLGIPPSGKPVDFSGLTWLEFKNGRVFRATDRWNRGEFIASLLQVRIDELREHLGLTAREAQVALLMADRLTAAEIASQLKIKPNTARRHCERVLQRLGVSRRQDVAKALGRIPGSALIRHGTDLQ